MGFSERMVELKKRYVVLISLAIIFALFGVPLIIHCLFKVNAINSFWVAEWTAGELLSYYGAVLAFVGTTALGVLSLYQNHLIKAESDKRTQEYERREYISNMPKFRVRGVGFGGALGNLKIRIENISENIANEVLVKNIRIVDEADNVVWERKRNEGMGVVGGVSFFDISLDNKTIENITHRILFDMQCKDKFDDLHKYVVVGNIIEQNKYPIFSVTEI